jgi:hypothetical protein
MNTETDSCHRSVSDPLHRYLTAVGLAADLPTLHILAQRLVAQIEESECI